MYEMVGRTIHNNGTQVDLKKCPFCGSNPRVLLEDSFVAIKCNGCRAKLTVDASAKFCAAKEAFEAWNRRTSDDR